jgi:hypothetical protein
VTVAALVLLARRLPAHAQPGGDLRPREAETDSVVDQHREFGLGLSLCNPRLFNPFQHLGGRHPGTRFAWPGGCFGGLLLSARLHLPGSRSRSALRPSHALKDAGEV